MAMIKIFNDRYVNSDTIDQITIEAEDQFDSDEETWNIYLNCHEESTRARKWIGQSDSLEDASKAVEALMAEIGINVVEFMPDIKKSKRCPQAR